MHPTTIYHTSIYCMTTVVCQALIVADKLNLDMEPVSSNISLVENSYLYVMPETDGYVCV